MSNLPQFAEYAAAFEESLLDDNWQRLERFFAQDAIYLPGDGSEAKGQQAAIHALKDSVDSLERRSDSRELTGAPDISEDADVITLKYALRYTKAGLPDFLLVGTETIQYAEGKIVRMEDVFEDPEGLMAWRDQIKAAS